MTAPTKETTSVRVERTIDASLERLYRAFQSRDEYNNWFCNNSFVQAREGGLYLFIWNIEKYSATGQFKELVENEKIVLSWRSTWDGNESDYPETLTITFNEADGGTKVTFSHEGMPPESAEGYEYQWNKRLDDLKQYVETGGLPNILNRVIIGIFPGAVDEETAEKLGLEQGVYSRVTNLVPGYSAEKAGIQIDDIITRINGQKISLTNAMNVAVQDNKPGDEVEVTVARGDEILTMTMPLSPYPVPDIPENYAALADSIAPQYEQLIEQIIALFEGVSEEQAETAPAEGEWNAKMVLAHLIYSEQQFQEGIGAHFANGSPQHWSGNDSTRLAALVTVNPGIDGIIGALRREYDETLAIWRNFPDETADSNKAFLWQDAFSASGWIQHTQGHIPQIQTAIEAAQK